MLILCGVRRRFDAPTLPGYTSGFIMDVAALDYVLDPALIAQRPPARRDGGKMLIVARGEGVAEDGAVRDLPRWLRAGDLLVVNDAEVLPARLRGRRPTGGAVEVLLTEPVDERGTWRCLARGARRVRSGERTRFASDLEGIWQDGEHPYRQIRLLARDDLAGALRTHGEIPLPPYIRRAPSPEDRDRYQTVFARVPGAIAAPTAGLHFTQDLLAALAVRGVRCVALTLLVGPATFLPIRGASVEAHDVPAERYAIPENTAAAIAATRAAGGRIVAVGTTTVRALESAAGGEGVRAGESRTNLVITPGHRFRAVDALLTNLHLPRSSLLALVAAFTGTEPTLAAYRAARRNAYRFYSYGDAMLIQ